MTNSCLRGFNVLDTPVGPAPAVTAVHSDIVGPIAVSYPLDTAELIKRPFVFPSPSINRAKTFVPQLFSCLPRLSRDSRFGTADRDGSIKESATAWIIAGNLPRFVMQRTAEKGARREKCNLSN